MNARRISGEGRVFHVKARSGQREFMWPEQVAEIRGALLSELERLPIGETVTIDFDDVGMSSGAARKFLATALNQIKRGGQFEGKGVVLSGLGNGKYDVKVMLESENLTAVVREDGNRTTLLGSAEQATVETYEFLSTKDTALAREVKDAFGLGSVAAATNRLARLAEIGVVRRVGQESAEGGGVQYLYAAVR